MVSDPADSNLEWLDTERPRLLVKIFHSGMQVFGTEEPLGGFAEGVGVIEASAGVGIVGEVSGEVAGCEGSDLILD